MKQDYIIVAENNSVQPIYQAFPPREQGEIKNNKHDSLMNLNEPPPPYIHMETGLRTTVIQNIIYTSVGADNEPIISGRVVGGLCSFLTSFIMTSILGVLGFIVAYTISKTHAGKNGARAGVGIMIMQFGMGIYFLSSRSMNSDNNQEDNFMQYLPFLIAYLTIFMGWAIIIKASVKQWHLLALRNTIAAVSST